MLVFIGKQDGEAIVMDDRLAAGKPRLFFRQTG
jgi:hypothetical protein